MSLSIYIDQIKRTSFYGSLGGANLRVKSKKVKYDGAENESLRIAALRELVKAGQPMKHATLVKLLGSTKNRVGFVLVNLYETGAVKRHYVSDTLWIAATEFADFSELNKPGVGKRLSDERKSAEIRKKIIDAVAGGCHLLADVEKCTGLSHCTVSKYTTLMRSGGEIVATKVPGGNLLVLDLVANKCP